MSDDAIFETRLDYLELLARGKVRDIYAIDETHMLIVATDRFSAFDVVFEQPIPGKGALLTEVSNFWFAKTADVIENHLTGIDLREHVEADDYEKLRNRSVIVRRMRTLPVEAIVRGYIIGSGWKDYQASGSICGIELPPDLPQAARLPEPIFTPSTKAEVGNHDINVGFDQVADRIGADLAEQVRDTSLRLYRLAAEYALERGIIMADTKFEFGVDEAGKLVLIDEILTPDSSRYWPADEYRTGISPPSFDKQFVRDYLETLDWDKTPPAPALPPEIIAKTQQKYRQVRDILLS
jgi:phosphoribosylaminoimidazole-succinocarboxamide synthase